MKTAIAAVIVASFSLVVAVISCVIAAKNYKKSQRLEFFQRRDQLFSKISDLNAKNTESYLLAARYQNVAVQKASLRLSGEQAERNTALIARSEEMVKRIEETAKNCDENIDQLHSICSSLTSETDAVRVERLIAMVQVASDNLKKVNDTTLSSLNVLEYGNSIIETNINKQDELEKEERKAYLDLQRQMAEITDGEKKA